MACYRYPRRPYFCKGCPNTSCRGNTCPSFIYHLPFHRLHAGPTAPFGLMSRFHRGVQLVAIGCVVPLDRQLPYNAPLLRFRVRDTQQEVIHDVELQIADDGVIVRATCSCAQAATDRSNLRCQHILAAWSYRILWALLCENEQQNPQPSGQGQPPLILTPPPAASPHSARLPLFPGEVLQAAGSLAEHEPVGRHTFEERVVGTTFAGRQRVVASLAVGDLVWLHREPQNPHDPNAVRVETSSLAQIGYIKWSTAAYLAARLGASDWVVAATVVQTTGGGSTPRSVIVRFTVP